MPWLKTHSSLTQARSVTSTRVFYSCWATRPDSRHLRKEGWHSQPQTSACLPRDCVSDSRESLLGFLFVSITELQGVPENLPATVYKRLWVCVATYFFSEETMHNFSDSWMVGVPQMLRTPDIVIGSYQFATFSTPICFPLPPPHHPCCPLCFVPSLRTQSRAYLMVMWGEWPQK